MPILLPDLIYTGNLVNFTSALALQMIKVNVVEASPVESEGF